MLLTLLVVSTFLSTSVPQSSGLVTKLVDAVDQNYLYAKDDGWQHLRSDLLANANAIATTPSLDQKLTVLHDGDLRIVTSEQMAAMQAETAGIEKGIGLVDFAVTVQGGADELKVVTPLVDSPAYEADLRPGDVIISINRRPTQGLRHEDVMALLRGSSGELELGIKRGPRYSALKMSRKEWIEPAVVSREFVAAGQRLGYLGIRLFTPNSGDQVRKSVEAFIAHGVSGCIVDVRNNPGGYLDALAVAGSAFTDQTLAWKIRRDNSREPIRSTAKPLKSMPLIVLVNEGTASAAEVLAAGLRDTTGARTVGTKTYGRGQIQTFVKLSESAGVVIPAASVESPHGTRFNKGAGLSPDVVLPSAERNGEDSAYTKGVELLTHN
jgi:carboxyl-terminal processing protease